MEPGRELLIIGDRVLIAPDESKSRTDSGLFLPPGIAEKDKVQCGSVVKVGPGYIYPHVDSAEPWQTGHHEPRHIPLQVKEGDYAIFLRNDAVEIEYEKKKYLIVPQSGVLAVVRDSIPFGET